MENSFKSSESLRNVDALVKKIEGICRNIEQSLAVCMEINTSSVGSYSTGTAAQIDSEFVDKIILTVQKIKNHLRDLKKALPTSLIRSSQDIQNIVVSLTETAQTLNDFLLANNFFYNNFQMPVMEIQSSIDQILEEIEVLQYADMQE